jgi:hypothetical protein
MTIMAAIVELVGGCWLAQASHCDPEESYCLSIPLNRLFFWILVCGSPNADF